MQHHYVCPACQRRFKSVLSYPAVEVLEFERLPTPEAVDSFSDEAAQKWLERRRRDPQGTKGLTDEGINRTPTIAEACERPDVRDYFDRLRSLVGREVNPRELLPPFKVDSYFRRTYPIPGTRLYLAIGDDQAGTEHGTEHSASAEPSQAESRVATIDVLCRGINLGSAGGPTLQVLGAVARLSYVGLLAEGFR
jgi:hypothetical protein